jgi:hypothetical protein
VHGEEHPRLTKDARAIEYKAKNKRSAKILANGTQSNRAFLERTGGSSEWSVRSPWSSPIDILASLSMIEKGKGKPKAIAMSGRQ